MFLCNLLGVCVKRLHLLVWLPPEAKNTISRETKINMYNKIIEFSIEWHYNNLQVFFLIDHVRTIANLILGQFLENN
jgi:hypothetical protein